MSARLFMHQTALAQRRRKQGSDRGQQSILSIRHDQIDLGHPTITQILDEATPAIFVFLCTGAQGQHFSAALQIHAQRR